MSWLDDFFLWLSATDRSVLQQVSDSDRYTQVALGMLVFATGILASVTGGFAIYMTLESWRLAVLVGLVYGSLIMTIDQFIVSATSRWVALVRLPLAAVIGLVIAVPLEMKLFEDRLQQKLQRETQKHNGELLRRLKAEQGLPGLQRRIDSLQSVRRRVLKEARQARESQQDEIVGAAGTERTGRAGKGPAYRNALRREKEAEVRAERLAERLDRIQEQYDRRRSQVMQAYDAKAEVATIGLLARFEALGELGRQSPAVWYMAWGLRLLIVMIEVAPALLKLLRPVSTYEALLKARRVSNLTRVNEFANKRVEKIKNNPENPPTPPFAKWFRQNPLST